MMRPRTARRIVSEVVRDTDGTAKRGVRQLLQAMPQARARPFVRYLLRDLTSYLLHSPRPVRGHAAERAHRAADWLLRAQAVTDDGGLSYGYFPLGPGDGWRSSYPETTGYTVPSLLHYSLVFDRPDAGRAALRMAAFLLSSQMPSGAFAGGAVDSAHQRLPVAFNTGMALMGLLAAYRHTGDSAYARGARRAAEFLAGDIGPDGYFRSHGRFVHAHPVKTYTCLCAWPLYDAGRTLGEPAFCAGAIRVGDATLRLQQPNGWFAHNCLSVRSHAPLLHTIAYTLQGLVELGDMSGERRFVEAASRAAAPLLPYCDRGFVHGRWFDDWEPAAFSSCLVGAAQVAVVCYRLATVTGEARYHRAADALVDALKGMQRPSATSGVDGEIVGALGGSFPLVGAYMPNGYPGWAAKFLLDALLHQHVLQDTGVAARVAAHA